MRIVMILFSVLAISSCSSVAKRVIKEPKVEVSRVSLTNLNASGGTIVLGVKVDNPNSFAIKLDELKYDLEIAGKKLSAGELPKPAEVGGNASTVVDVPVPVKFNELFSSAMDFLSKSSTAYRVSGEARFGLITLPFDKTGEMKLK